MLITSPQSIGPVNTVTYSITAKNQFNEKGTYGANYFDATKIGMSPTVVVKYDESKTSAIRRFCGSRLTFTRADGTKRYCNVNFTVIGPDDLTDTEVEDSISFHKLVLGISSFGVNFADRIA